MGAEASEPVSCSDLLFLGRPIGNIWSEREEPQAHRSGVAISNKSQRGEEAETA